MSNFDLLRNKEILAILDGDKSYGEINGVKISMPYLSGPDLCSLSTRFGLVRDYSRCGQNLSRWNYLSDLISYCIENNKISSLLSCLFQKDNFVSQFKELTPKEIDETYTEIINTIIGKINGILYCSGYELVKIGEQFLIKLIEEQVVIEAPVMKNIDRSYIKNLSDNALLDVENNNFDSAITKSRTILEEVFCYVIEEKNENPNETGDITKLYVQVKNLYSMHQDKTVDKRVNDLLSGLNKIIDSISQMRNNSSDSHGVGKKRINIADYHARLYVNAAIMTAEFILSVAQKQNSKG